MLEFGNNKAEVYNSCRVKSATIDINVVCIALALILAACTLMSLNHYS